MPMKRFVIILAVYSVGPLAALGQDLADLPPTAQPGECYVELYSDEQVEWVTRRIVDEPASVEIRTHPAVYETVEERHLVKEATTVYKSVPATYKTVLETIEVKPGTSTTVAKQVLAEPARLIEEQIPAEYQTVLVNRLVSPEREERIEHPATYVTIETPVVTGTDAAWYQLMCDDTPRAKIAEVQAALSEAGYTAVADGIFGPETLAAMEAYQRAEGLAVGYLTVATVERLGVSPD